MDHVWEMDIRLDIGFLDWRGTVTCNVCGSQTSVAGASSSVDDSDIRTALDRMKDREFSADCAIQKQVNLVAEVMSS